MSRYVTKKMVAAGKLERVGDKYFIRKVVDVKVKPCYN